MAHVMAKNSEQIGVGLDTHGALPHGARGPTGGNQKLRMSILAKTNRHSQEFFRIQAVVRFSSDHSSFGPRLAGETGCKFKTTRAGCPFL
jgi:hypothetical protein